MPTLHVYVDAETLQRLEAYSKWSGRTVDQLADAAIAEAALEGSKWLPRAYAPVQTDKP